MNDADGAAAGIIRRAAEKEHGADYPSGPKPWLPPQL